MCSFDLSSEANAEARSATLSLPREHPRLNLDRDDSRYGKGAAFGFLRMRPDA
jgi:hypothetical protein